MTNIEDRLEQAGSATRGRFAEIPNRSWREVRSTRHRWRLVTAGAAVLVAVVAALSIANGIGGHGLSIVETASAALAIPEEAIVHVKVVSKVTEIGGAVFTSTKETWAYSSTSNVIREVVAEPDTGTVAETAVTQSGIQQIYDPSTNTVHQFGEASPARMGPGPLEEFLDEIRSRLDSGALREGGREKVNGRDVVRLVETATAITDGAGRTYGRVYFVDAVTGDPVQLRETRDTEDEVLDFAVFETLPASEQNLALVSLTKQHPDAELDTNPDRYLAAFRRINDALSVHSLR